MFKPVDYSPDEAGLGSKMAPRWRNPPRFLNAHASLSLVTRQMAKLEKEMEDFLRGVEAQEEKAERAAQGDKVLGADVVSEEEARDYCRAIVRSLKARRGSRRSRVLGPPSRRAEPCLSRATGSLGEARHDRERGQADPDDRGPAGEGEEGDGD